MDWTIGHRHFCSLRVSGRLLFGFNLVLITELKTEHANGNSTPSLLVSIRVFSWRHSWNQNTEVLTESVDVELLSANCIRRKSRYRFFRSNSSIFSHVGIFSIFSFWSAALCGTSFRSNFPRQLSLWIDCLLFCSSIESVARYISHPITDYRSFFVICVRKHRPKCLKYRWLCIAVIIVANFKKFMNYLCPLIAYMIRLRRYTIARYVNCVYRRRQCEQWQRMCLSLTRSD